MLSLMVDRVRAEELHIRSLDDLVLALLVNIEVEVGVVHVMSNEGQLLMNNHVLNSLSVLNSYLIDLPFTFIVFFLNTNLNFDRE